MTRGIAIVVVCCALLAAACAGGRVPSGQTPQVPATQFATEPAAPETRSATRIAAATAARAKSKNASRQKARAPALDLKSLETRLKDTPAIGVMTKLSLKNQVDDLLDRFRSFYQGSLETTLAELHGAFDRLLLKVLTLLQDGDPSLAQAIVASRDAIWGILSDRTRFAAFEKG